MELKDRVAQISTLIAELRQSAGDGRKSRELIDSLFRAVHSFKAAAAAEGRHDLSGAAHQFESILQALRTGELALDKDVLEFCELSAAGLLDGSGVSSFDSFTLIEIDMVRSQALLPAEFSSLRVEEQHRATEAMREGSNLYVMEAAFDLRDFDTRFPQLKEKLGEIISTEARTAGHQADKVVFRIIYAAQSEQIRVHTIFEQAIRAGRAAATELGKQVNFVAKGDEVLVDRPLCDVLTDSLFHLVRNAVDHGIESQGNVVLEATTVSGGIRITVTDDGRGIAPENLSQIFQPGFSTATGLTIISGRGFGLDIVATAIKDAGGSVSVTSESGKGSSFRITLPFPT